METPQEKLTKILDNERFFRLAEDLTKIISNKQLSDRSFKLSRNYLEIAEDDLKAAEVLYANKIYPESVFYLQQSVEKMSKAFGILYDLVPKKKLRNIQHFTPIVFIKILKRKWMFNFIALIRDTYPEYKNMLQTSQEELTKIEQLIRESENRQKMAKMSKEEITAMLAFIKKYRESLESEEIRSKINEIMEILEEAKKEMNGKDQVEIKFIEQLSKLIKRIKEDKQGFIRLVAVLPSLYILSIITYPHSTYTRYPDGKLTPKDYKPGLGIVDCLPDLFPEVKNNIEALKIYLQE